MFSRLYFSLRPTWMRVILWSLWQEMRVWPCSQTRIKRQNNTPCCYSSNQQISKIRAFKLQYYVSILCFEILSQFGKVKQECCFTMLSVTNASLFRFSVYLNLLCSQTITDLVCFVSFQYCQRYLVARCMDIFYQLLEFDCQQYQ